VLGTASQVPTRHRNQNGYLLRWDGEGLLFDPGEGTQRQLMLAGVAASSVTQLCLSHFLVITAWVCRASCSGCPWIRCGTRYGHTSPRRAESSSPGTATDRRGRGARGCAGIAGRRRG